jgi:hypothetical protein
MRSIRSLLCALMLLGLAGTAVAVPPAGSGGGYYGSAWFDSDQGIVVTGSTYWECNQALQSGIAYRTSNWGWTVTELTPCQYRPPFSPVAAPFELTAQIVAGTPDGSLDEANAVLAGVANLRRAHDMDRFDASLGKLLTGDLRR